MELIAAAAGALTLMLAPSAFAQDFCVPSCSGPGTPKPTLEDALAAADSSPGLDRVLLAAGTYTAPTTTGFGASGGPVEVIGAGVDATTLTGPVDTSTVLGLSAGGSRVTNLRILIPLNATNSVKTGLLGNGLDANGIEVAAASGITANTLGVGLYGGSTLERSNVALPLHGAFSVGVNLGIDSVARDSSVAAKRGIALQDLNAQAIRDRVTASATGVAAMSVATTVTDSLVEISDGGTGLYVNTGYGTDTATLIRNSTLVGSGAGSEGVTVVAIGAHKAGATVDSTIIRGFDNSLVRAPSAGTADLSVAYSDFSQSTILDTGGAGTMDVATGNIDTDPLFAGSEDFHVLASSPVIDAGNPADLGDTEDLDADARVADGDGDGVARRDMGAFEMPEPLVVTSAGGDGDPAPAPDPAPAGDATAVASSALPAAAPIRADRVPPLIANLRVVPKRRLSFSVSEYAIVHVVIKRRMAGGRMRRIGSIERAFMPGARRLTIGRVGGKALPRGRYTATVTANDVAQNRSPAQVVRFRVV